LTSFYLGTGSKHPASTDHVQADYAYHKRKKTVARILNDRGHRTRNGSLFSDTTIQRLIEEETPTGTRRVNYTKSSGNKKPAILKDKQDWIYVDVPAIIDKSLFQECQSILLSQKSGKPKAKKVVQLFGGVTYCLCGSPMYVKQNSPKYVCTTCKKKISIDDLEAIFIEELNNFVFDDSALDTYLDEGRSNLQNKEREIATLEKEYSNLNSEMNKLYSLYQADGITISVFKEKNTPLQTRKSQIEKSLPLLESEVDLEKLQILNKETIKEGARDLSKSFTLLPFLKKRQIVESIIDRIVVGDGEVNISLLSLPQGDGKWATNHQGFIAVINWNRAG
jgi:site-specific DNA recombinase